MNLTFKLPEGWFNYRVCGVLLHEQKPPAMVDDRSLYCYLPGGRMNLHETAVTAICRGLRGELEIKARIFRPLRLNQSFLWRR